MSQTIMSCTTTNQTTASLRSLHPLITQPIVNTSKYYCPFLERGFCRDWNRCHFSHDVETSYKIPEDYCHFFLANSCLYGQECKFEHSEPYIEEDNDSGNAPNISEHSICDLCGQPCLVPYDLDQQRQHREDCIRDHERDMELSFAIQRSVNKICGICMEIIIDKEPITSRRFGILEKCNHIFCLECIRKWRGTKQFEAKTIRACPECRVASDFVVPSKYWVEDDEDKGKLIQDYKNVLRSKPCKYFDHGKGECPFAGFCFYKHAYPDGKLAHDYKPKQPRRKFDRNSSPALTILLNFLTTSNRFFEDLYSEDDDDDYLVL